MEAVVAWWCFFNDLIIIKDYLRSHWQPSEQPSLSLVSRALVTSTALRYVRPSPEPLSEVFIGGQGHFAGL